MWPAPDPATRQPKPQGPVYRYKKRQSEFVTDPTNPIMDHWVETFPGGWLLVQPYLPDGVRD